MNQTSLINSIHTVLVLCFVGVTALLLVMTLLQRFKIRGVCMSWRSSKISNLPVWPTLFMGIVAVVMVYAQNANAWVSPTILLGYFLGGMLWFMAVALLSNVIVTEYGLIPESQRADEAIGWAQISDYFEVEEQKQVHFAFMYTDFLGQRKRLDFQVPRHDVERFRSLVRAKLDVACIETAQHVTRRKALEN